MSNEQVQPYTAAGYTYVEGSGRSICIRESVDSLCRDGADTPIKP